MSPRDEDEAWKAIVDNYGERADLPDTGDLPRPEGPFAGEDADGTPPLTDAHDDVEEEDRFVPPPPPPLPRAAPARQAAWIATLGAPVLMLALALLDVRPPTLVLLAACAAFVGGFLYLVVSMDRNPRDPWDDGARI